VTDQVRLSVTTAAEGVVVTPVSLVTTADDSTPGARHVTRIDVNGSTSPSRQTAKDETCRSLSEIAAIRQQGLLLPRSLTFDKWVHIGTQLAQLADSTAWCLGDWLVYGEAAYSGRYRDAVEVTSLNYQTLRNYAWVARAFELSRRRDTLSFGHHAELAGLPEPEQDYWLRKAEELDWSCKQLRREVRASLKERGAATESDDPDTPHSADPGLEGETGSNRHADDETGEQPETDLTIRLGHEQRAMCEKAANRNGLTVDMWAARELEEAARRALSYRQAHT
jgi:hypothetical protein